MKQILKLITTLLIMLLLTPVTSWSQLTPVVDGIETEWPAGLIRKDSLHGLEYATIVSGETLYTLVVVSDPMLQNKALNAGMEIGFDLENKQKPVQSIQFPLSRVAEMFASGGMGRGIDMDAMRLLSLMQAKSYTLKKFSKGNGTFELAETNEAGVKLSLAFNEKGMLVYETSVPLASLKPRKGGEALVMTQVGVDIEVHGIEPPSEMPSYNAQPPAGGRGGGGRGGAGGSGVPAGGGGRGGPGGGVRFNDGGGRDDRMKKMQETVKVHAICELK